MATYFLGRWENGAGLIGRTAKTTLAGAIALASAKRDVPSRWRTRTPATTRWLSIPHGPR